MAPSLTLAAACKDWHDREQSAIGITELALVASLTRLNRGLARASDTAAFAARSWAEQAGALSALRNVSYRLQFANSYMVEEPWMMKDMTATENAVNYVPRTNGRAPIPLGLSDDTIRHARPVTPVQLIGHYGELSGIVHLRPGRLARSCSLVDGAVRTRDRATNAEGAFLGLDTFLRTIPIMAQALSGLETRAPIGELLECASRLLKSRQQYVSFVRALTDPAVRNPEVAEASLIASEPLQHDPMQKYLMSKVSSIFEAGETLTTEFKNHRDELAASTGTDPDSIFDFLITQAVTSCVDGLLSGLADGSPANSFAYAQTLCDQILAIKQFGPNTAKRLDYLAYAANGEASAGGLIETSGGQTPDLSASLVQPFRPNEPAQRPNRVALDHQQASDRMRRLHVMASRFVHENGSITAMNAGLDNGLVVGWGTDVKGCALACEFASSALAEIFELWDHTRHKTPQALRRAFDNVSGEVWSYQRAAMSASDEVPRWVQAADAKPPPRAQAPTRSQTPKSTTPVPPRAARSHGMMAG